MFHTNEGNIGGIYTPLSWDNNSEWKNDMETFIFNLNKNQKYKKIKNNDSILCDNDKGPCVYSLGFYGNKMRKIRHQGISINKYFDKGPEILPNNSSDLAYFDIIEVEVYKIILENMD